MFGKVYLFPFTGYGRETPTLLGPLERGNRNHWTSDLTEYVSSSPHRKTEFRILDDGH
jgi:hypothetical protein